METMALDCRLVNRRLVTPEFASQKAAGRPVYALGDGCVNPWHPSRGL